MCTIALQRYNDTTTATTCISTNAYVHQTFLSILPSSIFHHPSSLFHHPSSLFHHPSSIVTRIVPLFASDKKPKTADVAKIANSILRDISDYGDSNRENQTDDLELMISL